MNLPVAPEVLVARQRRATAAMANHGIDALCLSIGSDLPYLTGFRAHESERLSMFVLRSDGSASVVVAALEAAMLPEIDGVEVVAWGERESPTALVDSLLGEASTVALGSQTWSRFTLALQSHRTRTWVDAEPLMGPLRMRKDTVEIEALRASAAVVDSVVPEIASLRFTGTTELEIKRRIEYLSLDAGLDTVDFCIVGSGPNGASPHHAGSARVIEPGDAVVIDFGGHKDGYCSDTTRNFVVGQPPTGYAEAYRVLHEAQTSASAMVRPGVLVDDLDAHARSIIDDAGYGDRFIHRLGHGIGLDVHEPPYLVGGDGTILEPGIAFSIEPGIYTSGAWGMRIEDIVVVTEDGVDILNRSDRDFYIVD